MDFWTDIWPATLAAQQMLTSVGDDMSRLPESVRIFLLVNGAQGVIDNGGYNYFFRQDWPGNPPYGDFADAYEAIGCIRQAADLRRVALSFPFSEPHLHKEERKAFIDARYDKSTYCVPEWGNALCGIRKFGKGWPRSMVCAEKIPDVSAAEAMVEVLVSIILTKHMHWTAGLPCFIFHMTGPASVM